MVLEGPSIKHQTQMQHSVAALSISQLVVFNSVKNARANKSTQTVRHNRDQETPLPMYIALEGSWCNSQQRSHRYALQSWHECLL